TKLTTDNNRQFWLGASNVETLSSLPSSVKTPPSQPKTLPLLPSPTGGSGWGLLVLLAAIGVFLLIVILLLWRRRRARPRGPRWVDPFSILLLAFLLVNVASLAQIPSVPLAHGQALTATTDPPCDETEPPPFHAGPGRWGPARSGGAPPGSPAWLYQEQV